MNDKANVVGQREQPFAKLAQLIHRLLGVGALGRTKARELRVRTLNAARDELLQAFAITNVEHAYATARNLVFVRRADPAASGAE